MRANFLPQRSPYSRLVLRRMQSQVSPPPVQLVYRSHVTWPITVFLLCAAILALGGFAFKQQRKIGRLNNRIASYANSVGVPGNKPALEPIGTVTKTVVCGLCRGEKHIVTGEDLLHRKRHTCPVCKGVGHRTVEIPPDEKICPDCHGMGTVFYAFQPWRSVEIAKCARCAATGLVASFVDTADARRTK